MVRETVAVLTTDTGVNLLKSSKTPMSNLQFDFLYQYHQSGK
jgi:hypothetical protein